MSNPFNKQMSLSSPHLNTLLKITNHKKKNFIFADKISIPILIAALDKAHIQVNIH